MKITLDSTESLPDALRVIGAVYGVRLVVADDDAAEPVARAAAPRQSPGQAAGRSAGRSSGRGRRTSAAATATTAELRAWARANDVEVNERGPVPASVREAYAAAN